MRWFAFLPLLAGLSLGFAPAPFAKAPRGRAAPLPSMKGTWVQVARPTVTLVVTHDRFEYHNQGGPVNGYGLRTDATKTPPTYDLLWNDKTSFVGIWKVEGDELTVYYRSVGQQRPTSFQDPGGFKEVFRRVR